MTVSLENKEAVVNYKTELISAEQIVKRIEDLNLKAYIATTDEEKVYTAAEPSPSKSKQRFKKIWCYMNECVELTLAFS